MTNDDLRASALFDENAEVISSPRDVWTRLSETEKPIVLYGTGNGADKILDEFALRGIECAGVFASDGFVRDRSFRGMKVLSRSDAEDKFGDFFAVIAFASSLPDVMSEMYALADSHETVAPDVPVCGGAVFDSRFFDIHRRELLRARQALYDERSREVFDNIIAYRLTGRLQYLRASQSQRKEAFTSILRPESYKSYADLGAYNGDTIQELLSFSPTLTDIYALEPDPRSFKKLSAYCQTLPQSCRLFNRAAWKEDGLSLQYSNGGRGASIKADGDITFYPAKKEGGKFPPPKYQPSTLTLTLDSALDGESIDYIKYDVEGAEEMAIIGSYGAIDRRSPDLCVSLYHRSEDIYRLVTLIDNLDEGYKLYIRRASCVPAWEINLYAVKK